PSTPRAQRNRATPAMLSRAKAEGAFARSSALASLEAILRELLVGRRRPYARHRAVRAPLADAFIPHSLAQGLFGGLHLGFDELRVRPPQPLLELEPGRALEDLLALGLRRGSAAPEERQGRQQERAPARATGRSGNQGSPRRSVRAGE